MEIQKTIYNYTKKTKISADDIKKVGSEKLSQDLFGFIEKLKNVVANLEPIIPAAIASNKELSILKKENEKAKDELNTSVAKCKDLEDNDIQDLVKMEVKESIKI